MISTLKGVQQVNLSYLFIKSLTENTGNSGWGNKMKDIQPPSDDQMTAALKEQFEQQGFPVKIGG